MKNRRLRIILVAIGLAAFYWVLESVVMVTTFGKGGFVEQLFTTDAHEVWMRSASVGIIFAFGFYGQAVLAGRQRVEKRLQTVHHFLEIANRHRKMAPLLTEFVSAVKEFSGCDSVGIRILDKEGNIPYQAYEGFSQEFYRSESPLSIKLDQCMCSNVIKGVTKLRLPYYTKGGSFYTNSTTKLLARTSEAEMGQTRNVCNQYGYESVVLVPINMAGRILGLIHIADHREDMVSLGTVETLEEVAMQLGTAVQRVWAEEELQESEGRYHALLNLGAQVGESVVMLQDTEQGIATQTFVSDEWPRVTGYPREELLGMSFFDLVHPGNVQASIDRHHRRMAGESMPGLYELSIIRKDGTEVPVELTSAYTTYKGQRANVAFIREITERKRMEEALRQSKERYHSLFEDSPISLWEEDWSDVKKYIDSLRAEGTKDLKTYFNNHPEAGAQCARMVKIIDVNKASLDLYRAKTKDELLAGLDRIFVKDTYNGFVETIILSANGHSIVQEENVTRTLNGDKNHIAVKWALLPGSEETWARILVSITDITERKIVERALRESEQKYRTIFETTGTAMCIDEEDTTISLVNSEFEKLVGYSKEDLEGKKSWTEFIVKEDLEWIKEQHRLRRISPDGASNQFEARVINKQGEVKYMIVNANVIPGTKGDVVSLLDITERIQAEQELMKYRDHLEELVRGRTSELTAVNRQLQVEMKERARADAKLQKLYQREQLLRGELEEQMKQRVEFTRALVHELKTPLTALLAAGDLLATDIKEQPHMTLVSNIQQGALNLNRSIDKLLDLSRGEMGMLRLRCSSVNIRQLLRDVADFMTPEATKRQQSLVLELAPSLPIVWGDQGRLREVLLNLLDNASKFTPKGGRIILKARQEESTLVFMVQDTGCGISQEKQKRLFKPYYRQKGDSEQYSGLGLGLALCKTSIKLHGGKIWATSQKGNGSTFTFTIPCERPRLKKNDIKKA